MNDEPLPQSEIILYQTEEGRTRIQCRFEDETVWLNQSQMAELFQTTQQNISLHVRNIYEEGELEHGATHKEFLLVRQEGARSVQRRVEFYNLGKSAVNRAAVNRGQTPIIFFVVGAVPLHRYLCITTETMKHGRPCTRKCRQLFPFWKLLLSSNTRRCTHE